MASIKQGRSLPEQRIEQWKAMLGEQLLEREYHKFLAENAGLFLSWFVTDALVISKLRLGSEFETDFVVVRDEGSAGIVYRFIEIETPHTRLFTKPNKSSNRLSTALAQITSWRRWLQTHPNEAGRLLPSLLARNGAPDRFEFLIIIGRGGLVEDGVELRLGAEMIDRSWLGEGQGVSIRSFDALTRAALNRFAQFSYLNPPRGLPEGFTQVHWAALSHREWKAFIQDPLFCDFHLTSRSSELIMKTRKRSPGT